jgi:hypothetical protein
MRKVTQSRAKHDCRVKFSPRQKKIDDDLF